MHCGLPYEGNENRQLKVKKYGSKSIGTGLCQVQINLCSSGKVIKENNLDATLTKVDDIVEMMSYNILSTPAVVVDGEVRIKGHVPSENEVKEALGV